MARVACVVSRRRVAVAQPPVGAELRVLSFVRFYDPVLSMRKLSAECSIVSNSAVVGVHVVVDIRSCATVCQSS